MTKALLIVNVIVGLLVIADMLYGRHMAKKFFDNNAVISEDINMDYTEMEMKQEHLLIRIMALEKKIDKPKRTSKKKTSTKK